MKELDNVEPLPKYRKRRRYIHPLEEVHCNEHASTADAGNEWVDELDDLVKE